MKNQIKTKEVYEKNILLKCAVLIAIIYFSLSLVACSKDPINTPTVDASTMKITSATDFTGADGDTVSFKFIPLNAGGGVVSGASVTWTCDNTNIGLAASGSGDIPTFTVKNKGTALAIAHIVATPVLNGAKGIPLTITIQATAAGNSFTMLNSLPLSTGIVPYHWYADAGKMYYGGTPKLYWNTPSDTSALYYGVVYKNNLAGQVVTTLGPGTNWGYNGVVRVNMLASDTASIVFKITKTDPAVYPTSLKINFIDPDLDHDKVFGGNTASFGVMNDSMTVDVSQRVMVQGYSKIDKTKPLTIFAVGSNTDYYAVPYHVNRFLFGSNTYLNVIISLTLSDGTKYKYELARGAVVFR